MRCAPNKNPRWRACLRQDAGSSIAEQPALREIQPFGIAQRPVDHRAEQQDRDIDQHQAGQDFVGVEAGAQEGRNRRPGHAAQHTGDAHERHNPQAGRFVQRQGHAAAGQRADHELALGADVPHPGPETHGQPGADQDQRRALHRQFGERVGLGQWLEEDQPDCPERILAEDGEQDEAGKDSEDDREDGRQHLHRP